MLNLFFSIILLTNIYLCSMDNQALQSDLNTALQSRDLKDIDKLLNEAKERKVRLKLTSLDSSFNYHNLLKDWDIFKIFFAYNYDITDQNGNNLAMLAIKNLHSNPGIRFDTFDMQSFNYTLNELFKIGVDINALNKDSMNLLHLITNREDNW